MKRKLQKLNIANIITSCRIVFSIIMLFFRFPSFSFFVLYILCGLSDVLDGLVARKSNTANKFGSKLDSFADLIFVLAVLIKIISAINISIWLYVWIGVIAIIKIANIIYGFVRRKKFIVEHTILNKLTGLL